MSKPTASRRKRGASDVILTPKQQQVLAAVREFRMSRNYSATIAELADALNVGRSTIFEHITSLEEKGLITKSPGRARSLRLTGKASRLLENTPATTRRVENCAVPGRNERRTEGARPAPGRERHGGNFGAGQGAPGAIPLAGRVAAGQPIEALEDRQDFSLTELFGSMGDVFALEVTGRSMIDEGIDSGDYVICRKTSATERGTMVVAIVDDDTATLKRYYPEKRAVRLEPANDQFEPIYSSNCRIEAVVIGHVRRVV